jgi:iron-sulfur cluster repair protein YtfE (RIC family)
MPFRTVRDEILRQHKRLRVSLQQLDFAAQWAVRADHPAPLDMERRLDQLLLELAAHMSFEENELARADASPGAWGPDDRARLAQEHQRQREELRRIARDAQTTDDRISLALAIRAFVSDVLLDMSLEEDHLARGAAHPGSA